MGNKQLMVTIDFHLYFVLKSMAAVNCLVTSILQNTFLFRLGALWLYMIVYIHIFNMNTLYSSSKHTHIHSVLLSGGLAHTRLMDVDFTQKYLT